MALRAGWVLLIGALLLSCCVLSFHRATDAAPPAGNQPFANPVEQRMEMIAQLKEIRALLKEQNALLREQIGLLRSGEAKVVISSPKQR